MDIELRDGSVIHDIPDGTSKQAIKDKLLAAGYDKSNFDDVEKNVASPVGAGTQVAAPEYNKPSDLVTMVDAEGKHVKVPLDQVSDAVKNSLRLDTRKDISKTETAVRGVSDAVTSGGLSKLKALQESTGIFGMGDFIIPENLQKELDKDKTHLDEVAAESNKTPYEYALNKERLSNEEAAAANPKTAFISQLLGAVAQPSPFKAAALGKTASLGAKVLEGAKTGAKTGALYGTTSALGHNDDDLESKAIDAAQGGALGTLLGGAAGAVNEGAVKPVFNKITDFLGKQGDAALLRGVGSLKSLIKDYTPAQRTEMANYARSDQPLASGGTGNLSDIFKSPLTKADQLRDMSAASGEKLGEVYDIIDKYNLSSFPLEKIRQDIITKIGPQVETKSVGTIPAQVQDHYNKILTLFDDYADKVDDKGNLPLALARKLRQALDAETYSTNNAPQVGAALAKNKVSKDISHPVRSAIDDAVSNVDENLKTKILPGVDKANDFLDYVKTRNDPKVTVPDGLRAGINGQSISPADRASLEEKLSENFRAGNKEFSTQSKLRDLLNNYNNEDLGNNAISLKSTISPGLGAASSRLAQRAVDKLAIQPLKKGLSKYEGSGVLKLLSNSIGKYVTPELEDNQPEISYEEYVTKNTGVKPDDAQFSGLTNILNQTSPEAQKKSRGK